MSKTVKYIILNPKSSELTDDYSASELIEYEGTSTELLKILLEMKLKNEIAWEVWIFPIDADILSIEEVLESERYPWSSLHSLGGEPVVPHTQDYIEDTLGYTLEQISKIPNSELSRQLETLLRKFRDEADLIFGCSYNGSEEDDIFVRFLCSIYNDQILAIDEDTLFETYGFVSITMDDILIDKRSISSFDSIGLYKYIKLLEKKSAKQ